MSLTNADLQAYQADLQWIWDEFTANLWQVHGEYCGAWENDPCERDQAELETVLARLGWVRP